MRTITNLIKPKIHVYVYFKSQDLCRHFLKQAESEGFTGGVSGKPTTMAASDILAVLPENKLCYLGYIGRMAYQTNADNVLRVDYEKYIKGEKEYLI